MENPKVKAVYKKTRVPVPISARDSNGEDTHIMDAKKLDEMGGKKAVAEGIAETIKYDRDTVMRGGDKKQGELQRDYEKRKGVEYNKAVDDFNVKSNDEKMKATPASTMKKVSARYVPNNKTGRSSF